MPELPEVETVRRGLSELIIHKAVKTVEHDTAKGFPNANEDVNSFLIGAKITDVRRRAKVLIIDLSTEYSLLIHLKMTGQLVFIGSKTESTVSSSSEYTLRVAPPARGVRLAREGTASSAKLTVLSANDASEIRFGAGHPNDSLIGELPDKSTRVTFTFTDGSHLYFNDQRKFGWVKLLPTTEIVNTDFMKKVGPEPLTADFTADQFTARFKRRGKTNIKAALLDQTVVAGIGNIYADETLWGAKIHPKRLVESITPAEFKRIYIEMREVMNLAIEKGGSSNHTYVNAEGKKGSYMNFARVFRREGLACPRCGTTIEKLRVAGRGTHICPFCQQL